MVGEPEAVMGFGREPAARFKKDAQLLSSDVTNRELRLVRSIVNLADVTQKWVAADCLKRTTCSRAQPVRAAATMQQHTHRFGVA